MGQIARIGAHCDPDRVPRLARRRRAAAGTGAGARRAVARRQGRLGRRARIGADRRGRRRRLGPRLSPPQGGRRGQRRLLVPPRPPPVPPRCRWPRNGPRSPKRCWRDSDDGEPPTRRSARMLSAPDRSPAAPGAPAPARRPALGADLPRRRAGGGAAGPDPYRPAHRQPAAARADRRLPDRNSRRPPRPRRRAFFGPADGGRQGDRAVHRARAARAGSAVPEGTPGHPPPAPQNRRRSRRPPAWDFRSISAMRG